MANGKIVVHSPRFEVGTTKQPDFCYKLSPSLRYDVTVFRSIAISDSFDQHYVLQDSLGDVDDDDDDGWNNPPKKKKKQQQLANPYNHFS